MTTAKPKLFYGWYVVFSCTLIIGGSIGLLWNCASVFVKPVTEALGLTRGAFTLYTTLTSMASTVAMPFYGGLFKKYGQKRIMFYCAAVCCSLPLLLSFSGVLWQFYLIALIQGSFIVALDVMSLGTLINNWFRARKGLATGIAYAGSSLIGMVAVPTVSRIVDTMGWQWGYRSMSLMAALLIFPVLTFVVKERPEDKGLRRYGEEEFEGVEAAPVGGLTRGEALKTPMFWMLGLGLFASSLITTGIATNFMAFMTDIGYSTTFASGIISGYMAVMCAGKLGFGTIFDKLGAPLGALLAGLVNFLAPLVLVFSGLSAMPYIFAFVFGLAYATSTVPPAMLTAAIFGNKDFASVYGTVLMFMTVGGAVGAPLCGFIFDLTSSYHTAWLLLAVCGAVATFFYVLSTGLGEKRKTW
ncbi:MAG TPA: MFS transporter [Terriglobales bacterium]|nr:MFS transporter [Terriglobales bacterium]